MNSITAPAVFSRRSLLAGGTAAILGRPVPGRAAGLQYLRASYQQSSILLQVARERNLLDPDLEKVGFAPSWSLLSSSPAQIGQADFVSDVAEAAVVVLLPLFPSLALYAVEGPSPHALGIVARRDQHISSFADLKGRRIAVSKAGSSFDFLLLALQTAGLKLADIHPVYLPEAGCLQAFRAGAVDAWATFDPFFTFAAALPEAQVLGDGSSVNMNYNRYYLANSDFVKSSPGTVSTFRSVITNAAGWVTHNQDATASLLSKKWENMPINVVSSVLRHRSFGIRQPDKSDLKTLQAINDRYATQGLVPQGRDFLSTDILI